MHIDPLLYPYIGYLAVIVLMAIIGFLGHPWDKLMVVPLGAGLLWWGISLARTEGPSSGPAVVPLVFVGGGCILWALVDFFSELGPWLRNRSHGTLVISEHNGQWYIGPPRRRR